MNLYNVTAIRNIFICSLIIFTLLLNACDDGGTRPPVDPNPRFSKEISIGNITVFNDVDDFYFPPSIVAVGYCDSLGNGSSRALLVSLQRFGEVRWTYIIQNDSINSFNVVKSDPRTVEFVALASGYCSEETLFRVSASLGISKTLRLPYQGTMVNPSELFIGDDGSLTISGWVDESGIERGFILCVDSLGVLQWSKYFDEPGKNVRCNGMFKYNEDYALACSSRSLSGSGEIHSFIVIMSKSGTEISSTKLQIDNFNISALYSNYDSGYVFAGTIEDNVQATVEGFVGAVDYHGTFQWFTDIPDEYEFIPIGYIKPGRNLSSSEDWAIYGNSSRTVSVIIVSHSGEYKEYYTVVKKTMVAKRMRYSGLILYNVYAGITKQEYGINGELIKSVGVVNY
jgi:hypothetical protein